MTLVVCDIDGCVADADGPLLARFWEDFGLNFGPEDLTTYESIYTLLDGVIRDPQTYVDSIFADPGFVADQPLILPSLVALRKIRGLGNVRLHMVTARPECTKEATKRWLDCYGIPYDRLAFSRDKAAYCARHQAAYMIEDAAHHGEAAHALGVGVFLVDKPYNRESPERDRFWRVESMLKIPALMREEIG